MRISRYLQRKNNKLFKSNVKIHKKTWEYRIFQEGKEAKFYCFVRRQIKHGQIGQVGTVIEYFNKKRGTFLLRCYYILCQITKLMFSFIGTAKVRCLNTQCTMQIAHVLYRVNCAVTHEHAVNTLLNTIFCIGHNSHKILPVNAS